MTALWLVSAAVALLALPGSAGSRRIAALARSGRLSAPEQPGVPAIRRSGVVVSRASGIWAGVALACGAAVTPLLGPLLGAAAGLVGLTVINLLRRASAARSAARAQENAVRALRLVIAELTAGATAAAALAAAASLGGASEAPLSEAALAQARGLDAASPLCASAEPTLAAAGHALRVAETTGAALATVLERVADDALAARDQRRDTAVALAGPRSSAALLAGLPVLGIALGAAMGAHPAHFLLTVPAGRAVCAAGVALDVAGVWWIAAILRRAERR